MHVMLKITGTINHGKIATSNQNSCTTIVLLLSFFVTMSHGCVLILTHSLSNSLAWLGLSWGIFGEFDGMQESQVGVDQGAAVHQMIVESVHHQGVLDTNHHHSFHHHLEGFQVG